MPLNDFFKDEAERLALFPIAREKIFLAHAAVTALPRCAADAMAQYAYASCDDHQEFDGFVTTMKETRHLAGKMIGAKPSEIALLGPTSLGLSLFANGINWNPGDEVICYHDDYPANVYPWLDLQRLAGPSVPAKLKLLPDALKDHLHHTGFPFPNAHNK